MSLTQYHQRIIIEHLKENGPLSTWGIAGKLGMATSKVLPFMKFLAGNGHVKLNERYTTANNYVWESV